MDSIVLAAGRKAKEVIEKVEQITYANSNRRCFRAHFIRSEDPVILRGCLKTAYSECRASQALRGLDLSLRRRLS